MKLVDVKNEIDRSDLQFGMMFGSDEVNHLSVVDCFNMEDVNYVISAVSDDDNFDYDPMRLKEMTEQAEEFGGNVGLILLEDDVVFTSDKADHPDFVYYPIGDFIDL